MATTLPPVEMTCNKCGYRWKSTARAGSSIRCPKCRQVRRMPASRPLTIAASRAAPDADNGLAELWAAEAPAAAWRDDLESGAGRSCPDCGSPLYWAGAHTVQLCPAPHGENGNARLFASPGAVEREREYAERRARLRQRPAGDSRPGPPGDSEAIALERRKGQLIGQLDAVDGDHLAPDVRRVLAWFRHEVDTATDQDRLEALVDLFADAGIRTRRGWRRGSPVRLALDVGDDDDQYDDDDQDDGDDQDDDDSRIVPVITDARSPARPDYLTPHSQSYCAPATSQWATYDAAQLADMRDRMLRRLASPAPARAIASAPRLPNSIVARTQTGRLCQSKAHPIRVTALRGQAPRATRRYQGGYRNYDGWHQTASAPGFDVCDKRDCRAWAEAQLRALGWPDDRQVYAPIGVSSDAYPAGAGSRRSGLPEPVP